MGYLFFPLLGKDFSPHVFKVKQEYRPNHDTTLRLTTTYPPQESVESPDGTGHFFVVDKKSPKIVHVVVVVSEPHTGKRIDGPSDESLGTIETLVQSRPE